MKVLASKSLNDEELKKNGGERYRERFGREGEKRVERNERNERERSEMRVLVGERGCDKWSYMLALTPLLTRKVVVGVEMTSLSFPLVLV